jgi:hypothetical protein
VDPRFMVSALIGAFCAAIIFAAITTVRHVSNRAEPVMVRPDAAVPYRLGKQSRQVEYDRALG